MLVDKYAQLNFIGDVKEPHYNGDTGDGSRSEVYIACYRVDRSKLDIKLRFSQVSNTSMYHGDWFITKKKLRSFKRRFNNNGLDCYVIPWSAWEPLEVNERSMHLI